jgi:hypothetical protein
MTCQCCIPMPPGIDVGASELFVLRHAGSGVCAAQFLGIELRLRPQVLEPVVEIDLVVVWASTNCILPTSPVA